MKSRVTLGRASLLLVGIGLQSAIVAVPGIAQVPMGSSGQSQSSPTTLQGPGAGLAASIGKSATAGQNQGPVVLPKDFSQLRVEPGDLLSISVYDTPELTDAYRVDPAGDLTLPMCGKLRVQGLTLSEVARHVEVALKDGEILNRPQVNVDVQQYSGHYVNVLGEVASPGRVTVIAPMQLSEILSQVGGLTAVAGSRIKIRHGDNDAAPEEDAPYSRSVSNQQTESILVRPGDTVIVPRAGIVYVLGAVARPGGYLMQEDGKLNVAEALSLSGGTLMQANTGGLRVIRRNPDGTALDFALSYDHIANGSQAPIELQAQDIVYVPMSKIKATFASTQAIIGETASASIYAVR